MKKTIEQISKNFYEYLPKGKDYFYIEELSFPTFLKQRIDVAIKANVAEQISFPENKWVNNTEEVQQKKRFYLNTIFDEARLPAGSAEAVIEQSVAETIKILVQPRKNIPEMLFRNEEILTEKALNERVKTLTVYQHFAQVLIAYIDRKGHTEISRDKCEKIIKRVDEKLTQNYSPSRWAQLLEPLFTLCKEEPDSNLFRLFFEDKKMQRHARAFEMEDGAISRSHFIEILSSLDLLHEGYGLDHTESLAEKKVRKKKERFSPPPPVADDEPQKESKTSSSVKKDDAESKKSVNTSYTEGDKTEVERKSLNEIFADKQIKKQKKEKNDDSSSITPVKTEQVWSPIKEEEKTGQKAAIWQQFMSSDKTKENEGSEETFNRTKGEPKQAERKNDLEKWLQDQKPYFKNELFNGLDREYEESISKISNKNSWKEASKTLQNEVFEKHSINMYSEAAVVFTDRLQDYFTNRKNRKK